MTSLALRVRRTIRQRGLLTTGDRVAIALSGGPDSVALALLLGELSAAARWSIAGLIHVNHGLRGRESDADENFCRDLAHRLKWPIEVARADVAAAARARRQSIEAAARVERYACFEAAALTLDATAVATGHTEDDQAETVLLRLFRGTGNRGLSAIRARRGLYVRPLLDCRRSDLHEFLHSRAQAFRVDGSNADPTVPRNRLRQTVIPAITADWPGAVAALARFAELAADDEQFLAATAAEVATAVTLPAVGGVQVLDVRGLNQLPAALARRIVRAAIEDAGGVASFRDVDAVRRLARADKSGGHLDLAGLVVERAGAALRFWKAQGDATDPHGFEYPLLIPGRAEITETGDVVQASFSDEPPDLALSGDSRTKVVLQANEVRSPLVVRSRRPGDRLWPFGAPGSRKLQDLLVDRKVPRAERDRVPLVVDATGRIVWVIGLTIAEECRVTTPKSGVVVLESKKGNQ